MKVLFLFGNGAVGKMTVGQELTKITSLKLCHNHLTIEPVIEVFGKYDGRITARLREVIFEEFAKSDNYGIIFTFMFAFDMEQAWEYLEHVKSIFSKFGAEFYYVELVASLEERLKRNETENRLKNKPSKRDLVSSRQRIISDDKNHRFESYEGEIKFNNYLKINNTNLSAVDVALKIKEIFNFEKL